MAQKKKAVAQAKKTVARAKKPAAQKKKAAPIVIGERPEPKAPAAPASSIPLDLRAKGLTLDEALKDVVRTRVARKLGKFEHHIERVSVRFADINGPRGGEDVECQVKIALTGAASVVVAKSGAVARDTFDETLNAAERAVRSVAGTRNK